MRVSACYEAQRRKSLPVLVPLLASPLHCHSYRQAAADDASCQQSCQRTVLLCAYGGLVEPCRYANSVVLQDVPPALCLQLFEHLLEVTAPPAVAKVNRYNKLKAALRMLHISASCFGALMLTVDKVYTDKTAAHTLFESEYVHLCISICTLRQMLWRPCHDLHPAVLVGTACRSSIAQAARQQTCQVV